jgi:hypothetical protein
LEATSYTDFVLFEIGVMGRKEKVCSFLTISNRFQDCGTGGQNYVKCTAVCNAKSLWW